MKLGQVPMDTEETNKTADSTFKPKSLRNRAKEKADALVAAEREREEAEERKRRREDRMPAVKTLQEGNVDSSHSGCWLTKFNIL